MLDYGYTTYGSCIKELGILICLPTAIDYNKVDNITPLKNAMFMQTLHLQHKSTILLPPKIFNSIKILDPK